MVYLLKSAMTPPTQMEKETSLGALNAAITWCLTKSATNASLASRQSRVAAFVQATGQAALSVRKAITDT